jgi:hypothetical protein
MKESQIGICKTSRSFRKSFWYHGIHDFLKEPPVLMDSAKTTKSLLRLKYYYFNDGYFDVTTSAALDTL